MTRLPALARFHEADHLKDIPVEMDEGKESIHPPTHLLHATRHPSHSIHPPTHPYKGGEPLPLVERVRRLVEKETGKRPTGPICLLTHLRYLGYTFNPVSFYYVWDKEVSAPTHPPTHPTVPHSNRLLFLHPPTHRPTHPPTHLLQGKKLETIVAEVSNTPWNEMHCYVLNPTTKGVRAVLNRKKKKKTRGGGKSPTHPPTHPPTLFIHASMYSTAGGGGEEEEEEEEEEVWNYVFQKDFHVSPFMGMDHTYDWEFVGPEEEMWVVTHMLREGKERLVFSHPPTYPLG